MKKITGTKEWAKKTINLFTGDCSNGCIYCYASANNRRFGKSPEKVLKGNLLTHNFRKRDYLTMYPSAHDIRMEDIEHHIQFLKNFLGSGSSILIVSKPSLMVIDNLCRELKPFQDQVEFRFTVGSSNSSLLEFYEPNAPRYSERYASIVRASVLGYRVSLSIEPMLDPYPDRIIEDVKGFVTGDIWIGKLNQAKARIISNGYRSKLYVATELMRWQAKDSNILDIAERLSKYPNVKWKDSIQEVISRNKNTVNS
jgi:DNA repair photolyase